MYLCAYERMHVCVCACVRYVKLVMYMRAMYVRAMYVRTLRCTDTQVHAG